MVNEGGVPKEIQENYEVEDPLAEATHGLHHWNDPGMDDFEKGWEEFTPGMRVEVRTKKGWLPGTIRTTPVENDRAMEVECDEAYSDNKEFLNGKGATIPVMMNTRRGIWSNIRTIPPPRENSDQTNP